MIEKEMGGGVSILRRQEEVEPRVNQWTLNRKKHIL